MDSIAAGDCSIAADSVVVAAAARALISLSQAVVADALDHL